MPFFKDEARTLFGGARSIGAFRSNSPAGSSSLSREGATFTPRQGVPNTFLLTQDGKPGTNLTKISTDQVPVFEQERYEDQIISEKRNFTTTGAVVKWAITPEADECIEVYHVALVNATDNEFWNLTFRTQNRPGGGNIDIHFGRVQVAASESGVLLSKRGAHYIFGGSSTAGNIPGSIILCGADLKPNGFLLPDVLNIDSATTYTTGKSLDLSFLARRVPPPVNYLNGAARLVV